MHDRQTVPATPLWRRLAPGVALGVVLFAASTVSVMHLSARWSEQAPVRAAREAAAVAEQQRREARDRAGPMPQDLSGRNSGQSQEFAELRIGSDPSMPSFLTEEQLAAIRDSAEPRVSARQPVITAASWVTEPNYSVRSGELQPGATATVRFNCRVTVAGRLAGCSATDSPAGTGLGRLILPQLDQALLKPMLVDGRPAESSIVFSVTFRAPLRTTIRPDRPASAPPSGVAIEPPGTEGPSVANAVPAAPPPGAIAVQPPEPAPAD